MISRVRRAFAVIANNKKLYMVFFPQLISAVLALMAVRGYSEFLSPAELGNAMLHLGIIALVDSLLSAPISQSVFFFASQGEKSAPIFRWVLSCRDRLMGASYPILGFALTLGWLIETGYGLTFFVISFYVLYGVSESGRSISFSVINAQSKTKETAVQILVDATCQFLMPFILIFMTGRSESVVLGLALARFISAVVAKVLSKSEKTYSNDFSINSDKNKNIRTIFMHALPFVGMGAIGWMASYLDRYAVAAADSIATAGVYALASGLVGRPYNIVTSALTTHFRPEMFHSVASGDLRNAESVRSKWLKLSFSIGLSGAVLFFVLDEYVLAVLVSSDYRSVISPLLPAISLAFTATISMHAFDNYVLANGKGNVLLAVQGASIPVMVVALTLGAFVGGAVGAAWGRLLSELLRVCVVAYLCKKMTDPVCAEELP